MSEQERLELRCHARRDDKMSVEVDSVSGTPVAYFRVKEDGGVTQTCALKEADARALFNWLGVWLHTPR